VKKDKKPNQLLRHEREIRGWSQSRLAELIGVDTSMISRWECGERKPEHFYREKLCTLFGKNAVELGFLEQAVPRQLPSLEKLSYSTPFSSETLLIGGLTINVIVLARGRYGPKEIQCFYDGTAVPLMPEFERMKQDLVADLEQRKVNGEAKIPHNAETYKLQEFSTGYREMTNGKEVPVLRLKFGPTDYFTQMVTDLNLGNPIRERYAKAATVTEHPVLEFASMLGINLNVITQDDYLILTERSSQAFVAGGRLHTSVGENLLRPTDAGPSGAPDPFRCALRGAQEELGIPLQDEDVVFSTFTVIPDFCQYSLIATIRIQQTRTEIEERWRFAVPCDKWENRQLLFYPHTPDAIAQFTLSTWNRWFNVALAAVILSLLDGGYAKEQIDAAFSQARSR
jgi:transcriptional regulator with XRE-family HTH domain